MEVISAEKWIAERASRVRCGLMAGCSREESERLANRFMSDNFAQPRRSPWTWAWLAWLGLFLAVEIPAAIRKAKFDTLSETVWAWFQGPWRRGILAVFMVALGCHFVFGASAWWLLTAVPLVAVILWAEFVERGA